MHKSWIRLDSSEHVEEQVNVVELIEDGKLLHGVKEGFLRLDPFVAITDDSNKRIEPDDCRGNEE